MKTKTKLKLKNKSKRKSHCITRATYAIFINPMRFFCVGVAPLPTDVAEFFLQKCYMCFSFWELHPQTLYRGFAPRPHWGLPSHKPPIQDPQLTKLAYAPVLSCCHAMFTRAFGISYLHALWSLTSLGVTAVANDNDD